MIHAQANGRPMSPERVSTGFKRLAEAAGLPVIKLREARHTAATLGLEAGLDVKVVSVQLGHANTQVTHDMYMKVRPEVLDQAAARVLTLVQGEPRSEKLEA